MAGMAGTDDLAAVAVGGSFYTLAAVFLLGFVSALHPQLAALRGAGRQRLLAAATAAALRAVLAAAVLIMLALTAAGSQLHHLTDSPRMLEAAQGYVLCITLAMPCLAVFYVLRTFCEALEFTRVSLYCGLWALACNIPLNYVFIFGVADLPPAGGIGCGIATLLSLTLTTALLALYIARHRLLGRYGIWRTALRGRVRTLAFVRQALPLGLALTCEDSCFTMIALLLAPLGPVVVAGHAIMLSLASFLYTLPLSIGIALSVMVGYARGAGSRPLLHACLQAGYQAALGCAAASMILLALGGRQFIAWYSSDPAISAAAVGLLGLCIINQLCENLQTVQSFMLRGLGDGRSILRVSLLAFGIIGLGGGWLLCHGHLPSPWTGARGFWAALAAGLACAALLYRLRIAAVLAGLERAPAAEEPQARQRR